MARDEQTSGTSPRDAHDHCEEYSHVAWPLIYKGRDQELSKQESEELGRLCEILKRSLPGIPGYSEEAQRFCTSLHHSGVFDSGKIADAERLLENVDHLRQLLN